MKHHFRALALAFFCVVLTPQAGATPPPPPSLLNTAIQGDILRFGTQVFLRMADGQSFRVTTTTVDAQHTVGRLDEGDTIIASGRIDKNRSIVQIDAVDFVGLRRIIGLWSASNAKGMMQFRSHTDLDVYAFALNANSPNGGFIRSQKNFKYTVSPNVVGEWVMFLSDETSTSMAFLDVRDTAATIKVLDSKTGEITNVLRLYKVGL